MKLVQSSITDCSDPGIIKGAFYYGSGLLHYTEKEFCAHGVCKDVTVCELTSDVGEKKYYLPLGGNNESKELVFVYPTNCLFLSSCLLGFKSGGIVYIVKNKRYSLDSLNANCI